MSNPVGKSEVETRPTSEISKQELADTVYKKLVANKELCKQMISLVKWSRDLQKKKGNDIPWSIESSIGQMSGKLIAEVSETLSKETPPSAAEVVYNPSNISLESLKYISPQEFSGAKTNRKGDVLSHMVRKSFDEKPLRVFDPKIRMKSNPIIEKFKEERKKSKAPQVSSEEYGRLLREHMLKEKLVMEDEIIKGYTYAEDRDKEGSITVLAGEFYGESAIPDSLIVSENNPSVLVGVCEVKSNTAEELAKAISLIRESGKQATYYMGTAAEWGKKYPGADKETWPVGADIDKEVAFVDILSGLSGGEFEKGADNVVILRFPNDIPNNLLTQYGEMVTSYGYTHVVIQKLPLSREELNIIGKEVIKSQWGTINFQLLEGKNFSDRDINALHEYAFDKE